MMVSRSYLLICIVILSLASLTVEAIRGGSAVNKAEDRGPHQTVGGLFWETPRPPVHLEGPCSAVLVCSNVILTAFHCLNFQPRGETYFTLVERVNALPGPAGVARPSQYEKVAKNYLDGGEAQRTRKVLRETWSWAGEEIYLIRMPQGRVQSGIVMAKLNEPFSSELKFPHLISNAFRYQQEANLIMARNNATKGDISGYGDTANMAGDGDLNRGVARFVSWFEPARFTPQGRNVPALNSINGFLLQFMRGLQAMGNEQEKGAAHACLGDSGGPVYVQDRLAGILDLSSDRMCNQGGGLNWYVNLQYDKHREFIHDYMATNCDDWRRINVESGDNEVGNAKPKPIPPGSDPSTGKDIGEPLDPPSEDWGTDTTFELDVFIDSTSDFETSWEME